MHEEHNCCNICFTLLLRTSSISRATGNQSHVQITKQARGTSSSERLRSISCLAQPWQHLPIPKCSECCYSGFFKFRSDVGSWQARAFREPRRSFASSLGSRRTMSSTSEPGTVAVARSVPSLCGSASIDVQATCDWDRMSCPMRFTTCYDGLRVPDSVSAGNPGQLHLLELPVHRIVPAFSSVGEVCSEPHI